MHRDSYADFYAERYTILALTETYLRTGIELVIHISFLFE